MTNVDKKYISLEKLGCKCLGVFKAGTQGCYWDSDSPATSLALTTHGLAAKQYQSLLKYIYIVCKAKQINLCILH